MFTVRTAANAHVDDDESSPLIESHDILIEAWVSLLVGSGSTSLRQRPSAIAEAAYSVYEACIHAKLQAARQDAAENAEQELGEGGEDDDTEAERLSSLATLGRACVGSAIPLLLSELATSTAKLQQYCELVASQGADAAMRVGISATIMEVVHEELDCLVCSCAHALRSA